MMAKAKYIKLGKQGKWEELCFSEGTLRLGYYEAPHDKAIGGDKESIRQIYLNGGCKPGTATDHTRQVLDFYNAGSETIWITFSRGLMWWCHALGPVEFIGNNEKEYPDGSRLRRTLAGWSCKNITGQDLRMNDLSGRLTRSSAYRQTICDITGDALDYLIRKINGQDLPSVTEAKEARKTMLQKTKSLISLLTPQDFELFVDILFSKSGWVRVSVTGKTMKDIDLELELPVTGERALVQIKTKTTQSEFLEYAKTLQNHLSDRIFYVYHTPQKLLENEYPRINLMNIDLLADAAVRSGMVDWLIDRV